MKPIVFTFHAAVERMAAFGLQREWVERVVRSPDWTEPDKRPGVERRFAIIPQLGNRVLRVACVEEEDHIRVVTVFPDRNAKRRHDPENDPRSPS